MGFITEVVPIDKRKVKVFVDGEFAFTLYKSECRRFGLDVDEEVTPEIYEAVFGVLSKRALNRALYLLKDRDYTAGQLENKLRDSGYPDDIVMDVVSRMQGYGYVNDYSYAESFVRNKAHLMSRRELEYKLMEKHVSRDTIKQVLSEYMESSEGDTERQAFFLLYRKKNVDYCQLDINSKQKFVNYFLRKGFSYENIVSYLREIEKINENGTEESLT